MRILFRRLAFLAFAVLIGFGCRPQAKQRGLRKGKEKATTTVGLGYNDIELLLLNEPVKPFNRYGQVEINPAALSGLTWLPEGRLVLPSAIGDLSLQESHLMPGFYFWLNAQGTVRRTDWNSALALCKERGMRLPTLPELLFIRKNDFLPHQDVPFFTESWAVPKGQNPATYFPPAYARKLLVYPAQWPCQSALQKVALSELVNEVQLLCVCDTLISSSQP